MNTNTCRQTKDSKRSEMSSLSMVEAELPPGFRFHPRDDELVCDYLMKKLTCCEEHSLLVGVDLNKCEPWDIPETACVGGNQWYFYSQQDRKYATGIRTNRATVSGYWKATGKDKPVVKKGRLVGMRKTLVFHQGRAPKGRKTDWVMHEFRLVCPLGLPKLPSPKDQDWVLCRVFHKSREEPSKPSTNSCDVETGSSSLPALTDSYTMVFNKTPQTTTTTTTNHDESNHVSYDVYDEQVSCFSVFNPDESNPSYFTQLFNKEEPNTSISHEIFPATTARVSTDDHELSNNFTSSCSACDKHVIKAVLSQLTKMEVSPDSERYLSDHVDSATVWSNQYY